MADILNKRNKVHHLDTNTDEDMYPIFETDVDGTSRNNKRLLPSELSVDNRIFSVFWPN
jgi:hypothetical protein